MNKKSSLSTSLAFTFVSLVLTSQLTYAQTSAMPKVSSRNAYRACLSENDQLNSKQTELAQRMQEHNYAFKTHQDEVAAHVATQTLLDGYNELAVDLFNKKIDQLNERVKSLNEISEGMQKEQLAHNAEVADWNKRCASIVVSLSDKQAVEKERSKQKKKIEKP